MLKKRFHSFISRFDIETLKKEAGSFFIDLAKLIFGGAVLGAALGAEYNEKVVVWVGSLLIFLTFAIGLLLLTYKSPKDTKQDQRLILKLCLRFI